MTLLIKIDVPDNEVIEVLEKLNEWPYTATYTNNPVDNEPIELITDPVDF
jgi:hypothetical protein